jgi:ubiquinone/menaquinone biosynthesis C-methylase UbiE
MSSKRYFDQVADQWDGMRRSFFSEDVREAAYAEADPQPGQVAADIGAGTGFVTEGLLRRGVQVIAVDQSPAMLQQMRSRFGSDAAVRYVAADGHELPLAEASVDYVFANMYLHHAESPAQAIAEMARVVRPGGELVITDLDRHDHQWLLVEHNDRWPGFERQQVKAWLTAAGLSDVSVTDTGSTCCATADSCEDRAAISIFLAAALKPA